MDENNNLVENYYPVSLQFINDAVPPVSPWPVKPSGPPNALNSVLLNIMEGGKTICNVDFDGCVTLKEGKKAEDVIKIIALVLARQHFR